jgi:type IV secretory pathway VirB2 component (pilin)
MTTFQRLSFRAWWTASSVLGLVPKAFGAQEGSFAGQIPSVPGTPGTASGDDARQIILRALAFVLNFLALIAVVFIIIAGIRLIVSQGEDDAKDKAKKTILYVIFGLLVVLFARVIVSFFTDTVAEQI